MNNNNRIDYPMTCPRCGYNYHVRLLKLYQLEHCPLCGYAELFGEFVKRPEKEITEVT